MVLIFPYFVFPLNFNHSELFSTELNLSQIMFDALS